MRSTLVSHKDGIVVLKPKHDLTGGTETDDLELLLKAYLANGSRHLIVDLERVAIVNSAGLRALENGHRVSQAHDAQFKVCNVTKRISWFVAQFAIIRRFETYETISEAIASFQHECDTRLLEV